MIEKDLVPSIFPSSVVRTKTFESLFFLRRPSREPCLVETTSLMMLVESLRTTTSLFLTSGT